MSTTKDAATERPWEYRDVPGAGLEIRAPVYKMAGVELPLGMPEAPIKIFGFTAPQLVQIAAERWVQFEPKGWHEMQEANAALIVEAVNSHDSLLARNAELERALEQIDQFNGGHNRSAMQDIARAARRPVGGS